MPLRSALFLHEAPRAAALRTSHVRVLLPEGMSASETAYALRAYGSTRVLEIENAAEAYCGWDRVHDSRRDGDAFEALAGALLTPPQPAGSDVPRAALVECLHFHGGAGAGQRFVNLGAAAAGEVHAVSAPYEALPASVRALDKGSDLLVTFATGSVSTMARNWAANVVRIGAGDHLLIGALDERLGQQLAAQPERRG